MNIKAMQELKKWINAEPRRYDQGTWGSGIRSSEVLLQKPPCGMVACLGGNAVLMAGYEMVFDRGKVDAIACRLPNTRKRFGIKDKAQEVLGLSSYAARILFDPYGGDWILEANELSSDAEDVLEQIEDLKSDNARTDTDLTPEARKTRIERLEAKKDRLALRRAKLQARAASKQIDYMIKHLHEFEDAADIVAQAEQEAMGA